MRRTTGTLRKASLRFALLLLLSTIALPQSAVAQTATTAEMFDAAAEGNGGNHIGREACRTLEAQESAIWVVKSGQGWCLRYYAVGVRPGASVVAGWLHGDILGSYKEGGGPAGHQAGLGVAAMVEQERRLATAFGLPFIFLARPGAYGSSGDHRRLASTRLEADLLEAQLDALTTRYRIKGWALGGHSGGGTLVAAMLARRTDVMCAVVSSGAAAYNDWLRAHDQAFRIKPNNLNAIDDVAAIRPRRSLRVIVMGDPRDENVVWPVQTRLYKALRAVGVNVTLLSLERGRPPEFHSLVDSAEVATGMCARGETVLNIKARLEAMPSQAPRVSN